MSVDYSVLCITTLYNVLDFALSSRKVLLHATCRRVFSNMAYAPSTECGSDA